MRFGRLTRPVDGVHQHGSESHRRRRAVLYGSLAVFGRSIHLRTFYPETRNPSKVSRHLPGTVPAQMGEDGQIVLSLHYQAGMRVSPSRVRLEQAVDSQDTIPFVRLRMSERVGRIMITWDGR